MLSPEPSLNILPNKPRQKERQAKISGLSLFSAVLDLRFRLCKEMRFATASEYDDK